MLNILLNEQKQDRAGQVPNLLEVEWICLVKRMKEIPKYICHDYFWAMNPMDILLTISIVFQAFCNFLKIMSTTPFRPKKPVYPRAKDIFIYKKVQSEEKAVSTECSTVLLYCWVLTLTFGYCSSLIGPTWTICSGANAEDGLFLKVVPLATWSTSAAKSGLGPYQIQQRQHRILQ